MLAYMAKEKQWAEWTLMAERVVRGSRNNTGDKEKVSYIKSKTCSIEYLVAKAPINSLSRVTEILSLITNVDLKMRQQLPLDCSCSTTLVVLHTAENMKDMPQEEKH
jgi:hypothetical protein